MLKSLPIAFFLAALMCGLQTSVSAQTFQKTYGGSYYATGESVSNTLDSGFVISGSVFGPGAGGYDNYLLRLDKQGNVVWGRTFGGANWDRGRDAVQALDGGFAMIGATFSFTNGQDDLYVQKTDANGNLQWSRRIGGGNFEKPTGIVATQDSGFVVCGITYTYSVGVNYPEPYLIKLDKNGNAQWNRVFYGADPDYCRDILATHDGGLVLAGQTRTWGAGLYDVYLMKLNATGNLQWARVYGGPGLDRGWAVTQTRDRGFAVSGMTESYGAGIQDIFVVRTDSFGVLQWARTIGGTGNDDGRGILEDKDGNLVISGFSRSFNTTGLDDFIGVKLDSLGNLVWANVYGGDDYDASSDIVESLDGNYVFVGYSQSFQAQNRDIYLIKTDTAGVTDCNYARAAVSVTSPLPSSGVANPATNSGLSMSTPATVTTALLPTQLDSVCNSCDYPTAEFEYFLNSLTISFLNTSNQDSTWQWDFGDGSGDTIREPAHEYAAPGTYTVTLIVGNNCGTDTLIEQVTIANTGDCRLVLRPGPLRGKDAMVHSRDDLVNTNFGISSHLTPMRWTWSGIPGTQRGFLEFDLSMIPSTTIIQSASLDLFFDDHPTSRHAGSNNWQIRTVDPGPGGAWNENNLAWTNQPTTAAPLVNMPATTNNQQDFPGINVTAMVQNMISGTNHGFMMRLVTEGTYRRVRIATSDHPDPNTHPRLTIVFNPVSGSASPDTTQICAGDTVPIAAIGGLDYWWRPGIQIACDTCDSTTVWPDSTRDYVAYIRDGAGCTDLDTVHIQVLDTCCMDTLQYTVQTTNPNCGAAANGSITINPLNGSPPYAYSLNGGTPQTANTFTGLLAGVYTVFYSDSLGCDTTFTVTLTAPPPLLLNQDSIRDPFCNGGSTGYIAVSASGGTPSFTYSLNGGTPQASGLFTNLTAGAYTIVVVDGNGCTTSRNYVLTDPPVLTVQVQSTTNLSCFGSNDGAVTVSSNGGTPVYLWAIDGGAFGSVNSFSGLTPGAHTVTVQDANGCTASISFTLTQPAPLNMVPIGQGNPNCNGSATGTVVALATGGTPAITYTIDGINFQPTGVFNNLPAGNHTVTAQDANGCTISLSFTLTDPPAISIALDSLAGTACNNGYVAFSASGGNPPYLYSAGGSPFQVLNIFNGLPNGSQWVYVQDANGCIDSMAVFIPNLPAVNVLPLITQVSCNGANDGAVVLNGGGGTAPLLYSNNGVNFQASNTYSNLGPGTTWYYVRDVQGCMDSVQVTITEPQPLTLIATAVDVSCSGANNGMVSLTANGGTFPYAFSIDGVTYGPQFNFNNLPPGSYTAYVTDAHACATTVNFTIAEPNPVTIALDNTIDITCDGGSNGVINFSGAGGTPPLQYQLTTAGTQNNGFFSNLGAGTYTATVLDANGCTQSLQVTLTAPPALLASLSSTQDESCPGYADGQANLMASGGVGPYTFLLDNTVANSSGAFSNVSAGGHTVLVTDANGCTTTVPFQIAPGNGPTAAFDQAFDPCAAPVEVMFNNLSQDGSLYSWTFGDGNSSPDFNPVNFYTTTGSYTVSLVVEDANGCRDSAAQVLAIADQPVAAFTSTPAIPAVIDRGDQVTFENQSQNANGYYWTFGDGGESRGPNPFHVYESIGEYCVRLVAYSISGCTDTTEACFVQVINGNVFIPTGFTPNGDQLNDEFETVTTALFETWLLQIYDRWGKLIWETREVNDHWDGTFQNKAVQEGSYVFRLQARTVTGSNVDRSGSVTVIR